MWKYKKDNKLRGAFGETDFDKKVIRVNVKKHKLAKKGGYNIAKKDATIINTLVHERLHKNHPKMTEIMVRKNTRRLLAKMGIKEKNKLRAKLT